MKKLFADTSGWGNLIDSNQNYHKLAANIYRSLSQVSARIVTTNYIITELAALMTSPLHIQHPIIVEFINSMKNSPHVKVVHIDPFLDDQSWQLFSNRTDKDWSLVDCSSFIVMEQLGIKEALTTDKHFEQAGFIRLLK